MKLNRLIGLIMIFAMLLSSCSGLDDANNPAVSNDSTFDDSPREPQSDPVKERIEQRCEEITTIYYDLYTSADKTEPQNQWDDPVLSQGSIDAIESLLIDAGLDVVDTNGAYPSHLATADRFYDFWNNVKQGQPTEQEIIEIRENGTLSYRLFAYQDSVTYVYSMDYPIDGNSEFNYEKHKILEWELTDKGNFYYRIYPAGDKHYSDFALIRMVEPNLELYDLTMKYIWAGGYIGTNIFLTDWTENDFGDLSFNDIWEYLYYDCYGEQFWPEGYDYVLERECYKIPASDFEKVVLPYFKIDIETFRELAQYDAEGDYYPWCQVQTNDYVFLYYYMVEPEVTAYQVNPDGTITLTVEMLSTDLKTDCLFAHEVTVRPLENGRFQFAGNKVMHQTEYGLPFCEPRLTWNNNSNTPKKGSNTYGLTG